MSETIKFKLARKTLPVTIEDAEGVEHTYTLRELSGKERDLFMKKLSDKARLDDQGKPVGFKDQVGLVSYLLSMSLLNDKGKPIKQDEIDEWPAEMSDGIAKLSYELSAIAPSEAAKVGNS